MEPRMTAVILVSACPRGMCYRTRRLHCSDVYAQAPCSCLPLEGFGMSFVPNRRELSLQSLMTTSMARAGHWPKCVTSEGEGLSAHGPYEGDI